MSDWLVQNHDALEGLGGIAAFISLMALTIGGLFAFLRFRADRRHQFVLNARALYYDYARLSIDNAEYFCSYWQKDDLTELEKSRYIRFVCYMINGVEDIICSDDSKIWRQCLKSDFRYHVDFLRSDDFRRISSYFFAETHQLIAEVLAEQDEIHQDA